MRLIPALEGGIHAPTHSIRILSMKKNSCPVIGLRQGLRRERNVMAEIQKGRKRAKEKDEAKRLMSIPRIGPICTMAT